MTGVAAVRTLVRNGARSRAQIAALAGWEVATVKLREAMAAGVVEYDEKGFLRTRKANR